MEDSELIERYLEGSLSRDESIAVEVRAQSDIPFKKLIDLHREVNESISDDELADLNRKITGISSEYLNSGRHRKTVLHLLKTAAVFIVIAGSVAVLRIFLFHADREERLYHRFYSAYEVDGITRSGSPSATFSKALEFYDIKRYKEALSILIKTTESEPQNYTSWFFRGLSEMQTNNFDDAIRSFDAIPDQWNNPYIEHRDWYLALSLIYTKKTTEAVTLLNKIKNNQGFYSKKASELLIRLRR